MLIVLPLITEFSSQPCCPKGQVNLSAFGARCCSINIGKSRMATESTHKSKEKGYERVLRRRVKSIQFHLMSILELKMGFLMGFVIRLEAYFLRKICFSVQQMLIRPL